MNMRKIPYFKKKLTVEEYIKKEICKNTGTQSIVYKAQLLEKCEQLRIPCDTKMSKEQLFELIIIG